MLNETWMTDYKYVKQYLENPKPETLKIPSGGTSIRDWILPLLKDGVYGKLDEETFALVKELNLPIKDNETNWWHKAFLLVAFKKEYNRLPKCEDIYMCESLGTWYYAQGVMYRRGTLKPERTQVLKMIEPQFGISKRIRLSEMWENNFNELVKYVSEHNKIPSTTTKPGRWLSAQRSAAVRGDLPIQRYEKLSSVKDALTYSYDVRLDEYISSLKNYIEEYGHFPTRVTKYNGKHLGSWLLRMVDNYHKGMLKPEVIAKVNAVLEPYSTSLDGEVFRSTQDESWDRQFEKLKRLYTAHQGFPNATDIQKGAESTWLTHQRSLYYAGILQKDRAKKLKDIGALFDSPRSMAWEKGIDLFKEWRERHGLLSDNTVYKGFRLGTWYQTMRYQWVCGVLPEEHIKELQTMGYGKPSDMYTKTDIKLREWNNICDLLKNYIDTYGKKPDSSVVVNDIDLYKWVNKEEKTLERSSKPSVIKTSRLQELGYAQNVKCSNKLSTLTARNLRRKLEVMPNVVRIPKAQMESVEAVPSGIYRYSPKTWNKKYELCKEYLRTHSEPIHSHLVYNGTYLGQWYYKQRRMLLDGILPEELAEKLKQLIEQGNIAETKADRNWMKICALVEEYADGGHTSLGCKTRYKGKPIGQWFCRQVLMDKRGFQPESRSKALASLCKKITPELKLDDKWDKKFELLKEFKDVYGKYPVTTEIYKGVRVGSWYTTQRKNLKNGTLRSDRLKKLKDSGAIMQE